MRTRSAVWVMPVLYGLLASVVPVDAAERSFGSFSVIDEQPNVMLLDGEIDVRSALDFRRALAVFPNVTTLVLNSVGGVVVMGLLIADDVEREHISTVVPPGAKCYSACAYVFFAGTSRLAVGELGVHQVYSSTADAADAQLAVSDIIELLTRFGVPSRVLAIMFRTLPGDMHVFSQSEIAEFGINRGDVTATMASEIARAKWLAEAEAAAVAMAQKRAEQAQAAEAAAAAAASAAVAAAEAREQAAARAAAVAAAIADAEAAAEAAAERAVEERKTASNAAGGEPSRRNDAAAAEAKANADAIDRAMRLLKRLDGNEERRQSITITQNELDGLREQVQRCWNLPVGWTDPREVSVTVRFSLERDGTVSGTPTIERYPASNFGTVAAEGAVRAIMQCGPYRLPPEKYDQWSEVQMLFSPQN